MGSRLDLCLHVQQQAAGKVTGLRVATTLHRHQTSLISPRLFWRLYENQQPGSDYCGN